MHIGFIGIGNMGSEQARHLLAAGHTLTTYARLRVRASAFGLSLVDTHHLCPQRAFAQAPLV
jgi:3-hydroxyisobutyrate dehydrogenase-like beta-hydroxyacid dehydrogenase